MKWLIVMILIYVTICEGFRYAWRPSTKVFPYETFPEPQNIDNGDNEGKAYDEIVVNQKVKNENNTCVKVWIGNGACNRENNKAECNWDGGDCCWASCIKNCPAGGISAIVADQNSTNKTNSTNSTTPANPKNPSQSKNQTNGTNSTNSTGTSNALSYKCKFACGSFKGYECRQPNQSCQECGTHGRCLPQSECLKGNASYTQKQIVGDLIQNCYSVSWSQGNGATTNIFCGKDPYKTILHDPVYPKLHYPGCGFFQSQCTLLPLCDDVLGNSITALNCDNVTRSYNFYSEGLQTVIQNSTSCYMHFLDGFLKNYRYYGQCCQCEKGWTGVDCNQAVCYPTCIHGTCIQPNVCVCDAGWQGVICEIGICTLCKYGVCTAPEFCECFYGYEGTGCDIPISMPPCHRGIAILPDVCQCDEGYQGRICDQPKCEHSCGPHGHCIAPNTCECDIGWESSDPTSQCDIVNSLLQDPNCIEADNNHCTACDYEFYLDPVSYTCNKCSAVFNEMCFGCNYLQCLECQWPYDVDPESSKGDCVSTGVVEFTDIALDVIEDQQYVYLNVRRNFGQKGPISVQYDMSSTQPENVRIEKAQGRVDFTSGQEISNITLNVFKRFEFESFTNASEVETQDTVFMVRLIYATNRAEIGDRDHVIVHYFDSYNLPDTRNTYSLFYGLRSPVSRINGQSFTAEIGKYYTLDIYSYYLASIPKTNGITERYYLIQRNEFRNQVREITTSVYISDNHHQISFWCYDFSLAILEIYASTSGMAVSYFSNTRFSGTPYLYRLEYLFPVIMQERQPVKRHSQYSIKYDFLVEFNSKASAFNGVQNVTFTLRTAEYSLASVFINDIQIQSLEVTYQECPGNYDPDGSSCCQKNFTYTALINGSLPQHFIVKYIQRRTARNGPCIKLFRQSQSLPFGSIEQDAIAIQPFSDGFYAFSTNVTDAVVDNSQSSLVYHPVINPNTNTLIATNQFQNCVPNNFQVIIRDMFGNEFNLIPSLNVTVTFTIGSTVITNSTVFNETDSSRRAVIYYCGAIGTAKVVARVKSELLPDLLTLTVIPGPYQLSLSDLVEWNQLTQGCQAHTQCQAKFDLRDKAQNLLLLPIALTAKDADFQLQNNNSTHYAEMFNTFLVSKTSPYSIFIQYIPRAPGPHSLFARFQGQKAKIYPLVIEVFSTVASQDRSYITDTSVLSPRVVTQQLTFYVQLCDILGNNLTESTYIFAAQIQSIEQPSVIMPQLSGSKVGTSLYKIQIIAYVSSNYSLSIQVTNQATGLKVILTHSSIQTIQIWQSHLVNHTTTTVTGNAFQNVYPLQPASIALQTRDSQNNNFNATFHAKTYAPLSIYNITVIAGANTLIPVTLESQNTDIGYFTFTFLVPSYYPQLTIYVQINELQSGYFNITGSPFTTAMSQRSQTLYCEIIDLHQAGYGLTEASYILSQPTQVVAGQNFTLQLVGINYYSTIYQPTIDPVQKLFIIDQVNQQCTCSPNSAFCGHFSGNYTQCIMNKQCRWALNSPSIQNANLNSCQPCNATCDNQSFTLATGQSRDAVYSYYSMQILQQGTHYTQVNVISQGFLRLMIFNNYDFTSYYSQVNIYDLQNLTFNSTLSSFFSTKRQMWSATIVGYIRYNQTQQGCFGTTQNRLEITSSGRTLVTWTLQNDLDSVVLINGVQVAEKPSSQASIQFFRNCTDNEIMLFEIRLRIRRPVPTTNNGFLTLEQETFKAPRNTVLPFNIFYVIPSSTSLQTQITVLPAAPSSATSQVVYTNCTNGIVPYSTQVSVKILDAYGNLRDLSSSDNVTISITKESLSYSSINVTQQDPTSKLYNLTVNLAESATRFSLVVNLNNVPITNQPVCAFAVYSFDQITTIGKAAFAKYNTYFLEKELDFNEAREFYRADLLKYGVAFDEAKYQLAFQRMDTDVNGSISEAEAILWLIDLATSKGIELTALKI